METSKLKSKVTLFNILKIFFGPRIYLSAKSISSPETIIWFGSGEGYYLMIIKPIALVYYNRRSLNNYK